MDRNKITRQGFRRILLESTDSLPVTFPASSCPYPAAWPIGGALSSSDAPSYAPGDRTPEGGVSVSGAKLQRVLNRAAYEANVRHGVAGSAMTRALREVEEGKCVGVGGNSVLLRPPALVILFFCDSLLPLVSVAVSCPLDCTKAAGGNCHLSFSFPTCSLHVVRPICGPLLHPMLTSLSLCTVLPPTWIHDNLTLQIVWYFPPQRPPQMNQPSAIISSSSRDPADSTHFADERGRDDGSAAAGSASSSPALPADKGSAGADDDAEDDDGGMPVLLQRAVRRVKELDNGEVRSLKIDPTGVAPHATSWQ